VGRGTPSYSPPVAVRGNPRLYGTQEDRKPLTQLATRIPKELHHRLKLHCVTNDISVMDFVVAAIEEKLGREAKPKTDAHG
jgi:hypothetical protein